MARFIRTLAESKFASSCEIWVDQETGVNYLFRQDGYGGGLTVLLGADGKPIVTPVPSQKV